MSLNVSAAQVASQLFLGGTAGSDLGSCSVREQGCVPAIPKKPVVAAS